MTELRNSGLVLALSDLAKGLANWRIWLSLSWEDLNNTYSRAFLGLSWIPLSFAFFVFIKVVLFANILEGANSRYYGLYLATGFWVWQYLSLSIVAATNVFVGAQSWIKNDPLPLSIYSYRDVARELYSLLLTFPIVIFTYLLLHHAPDWTALWGLAALAAFVLNAVWLKLFLGVLSTRYRDIGHLVNSIMRIMLFLSPIFWLPDQIGPLLDILWWNPLYHFIMILRAPLIDSDPAFESWVFVGWVTLGGWISALALFSFARKRIVFWL